jgi:hypothetical protein
MHSPRFACAEWMNQSTNLNGLLGSTNDLTDVSSIVLINTVALQSLIYIAGIFTGLPKPSAEGRTITSQIKSYSVINKLTDSAVKMP